MIIVVFRQCAATARLRALFALSSEYSAVNVRWGQVAVRRTSRSGPESNRSLGLWIIGFRTAWAANSLLVTALALTGRGGPKLLGELCGQLLSNEGCSFGEAVHRVTPTTSRRVLVSINSTVRIDWKVLWI